MADLIVKTSKGNDRKEIYFRPSSKDPWKNVCKMTLQKLLKKPGCCEWLLHTLTAWVRFSPQAMSLSASEIRLGYGVHLLDLGQFVLDVTEFNFITSIWNWSPAYSFDIGGSFY